MTVPRVNEQRGRHDGWFGPPHTHVDWQPMWYVSPMACELVLVTQPAGERNAAQRRARQSGPGARWRAHDSGYRCW